MQPSTDLVSIIDNINGTYWAQKDKEYLFKYLNLTPLTQTRFAIRTNL